MRGKWVDRRRGSGDHSLIDRLVARLSRQAAAQDGAQDDADTAEGPGAALDAAVYTAVKPSPHMMAFNERRLGQMLTNSASLAQPPRSPSSTYSEPATTERVTEYAESGYSDSEEDQETETANKHPAPAPENVAPPVDPPSGAAVVVTPAVGTRSDRVVEALCYGGSGAGHASTDTDPLVREGCYGHPLEQLPPVPDYVGSHVNEYRYNTRVDPQEESELKRLVDRCGRPPRVAYLAEWSLWGTTTNTLGNRLRNFLVQIQCVLPMRRRN